MFRSAAWMRLMGHLAFIYTMMWGVIKWGDFGNG